MQSGSVGFSPVPSRPVLPPDHVAEHPPQFFWHLPTWRGVLELWSRALRLVGARHSPVLDTHDPKLGVGQLLKRPYGDVKVSAVGLGVVVAAPPPVTVAGKGTSMRCTLSVIILAQGPKLGRVLVMLRNSRVPACVSVIAAI